MNIILEENKDKVILTIKGKKNIYIYIYIYIYKIEKEI